MTDELISRESVIALCRDISEAAISVPVERAFKRMMESIPALPAVQPQVAAPDVAGLVERLRDGRTIGCGDCRDILNEAADTLARLDREKNRLRIDLAEAEALELQHGAVVERLDRELQAARGTLADPVAVHANMLRGTIAKPTVEQIIHLYGRDVLMAALKEEFPNV